MKTKKERVVAIDYFRGVCMLAVILDHSSYFSYPLNFLVGAGRLWTGAAEMFFLLSGITFWIVRSDLVKRDFKAVLTKSWRRAGLLYLIYFAVALISLSIATLLVARGQPTNMPEALPTAGLGSVMANLLILRYHFGWADFLMYYSIFLLVAPVALYTLRSRLWPIVPLASLALFVGASHSPLAASPYFYFFVWQVYFFLGMAIGRLRLPLLRALQRAPRLAARGLAWSVVALAGVGLLLCAFLEFRTTKSLNMVNSVGWLPVSIKNMAASLVSHKPAFDRLLESSRSGELRPLIAVWALGAGYIIYQRFKKPLLKHTGNFVNAIGRNSLPVFVAQAIVIPILAAIPVSHNILPLNMLITAVLLAIVWMATKKELTAMVLRAYSSQFYTVLLS